MNTIEKYKPLIEEMSRCSVVVKDESNILIQPLHQEFPQDWGLAEWNVFELGNGDGCCFYWKIGAEEENPIVCALHHDDWELFPWSSSIFNFFRLIAANRIETEPLFSNDFWFKLDELKDLLEYYHLSTEFLNIAKATTLEEIIKVDNQSPVCLKYMGDLCKQKGNLDLAKDYYLNALASLPEYGHASFALGMLYRSQCQDKLAIPHFIDSVASPFYFSKEKEKTIRMLSAYKDSSLHDNKDPIWNRRHEIQLDDGEKYPTFHKILNEIIEEYIQLKEFRRAIGLRIYLGSFARDDERLTNRYQLKEHQRLLRQDLEAAGMEKRILLLGL